MKPYLVILATTAVCAAFILAPAPGLGQEKGPSARGSGDLVVQPRREAVCIRNAGYLEIVTLRWDS